MRSINPSKNPTRRRPKTFVASAPMTKMTTMEATSPTPGMARPTSGGRSQPRKPSTIRNSQATILKVMATGRNTISPAMNQVRNRCRISRPGRPLRGQRPGGHALRQTDAGDAVTLEALHEQLDAIIRDALPLRRDVSQERVDEPPDRIHLADREVQFQGFVHFPQADPPVLQDSDQVLDVDDADDLVDRPVVYRQA